MARTQSGDMEQNRRILVVDDHPLICRGLAQMINDEEGLAFCGNASDINEAIRQIDTVRPHLVVIDISLKSSSGIELIKAVRARHPGIFTLVYSMHDESVFAERAFRAGARGYVMKDQPAEILIAAIKKVLNGHTYFSDTIITRMLNRFARAEGTEPQPLINRLTDRELEILQLIGQGLRSGQVAEKLNISTKTVDAHREHIRKKLEIRDSSELAAFAKEWIQGGLKQPPASE
jgi:DNA-binding NarL/FixJ family response regulator